jgi:DnaJ like chaperone protein
MYEAEIRFKQGSRRKHSSNRQRQQATEYTQQQRLTDAYKILGVDKSAQNADVKKAYRKLMATHHPDKLISKGLPEQAMKIAKNKAQDIQAAYELIKKERGI